MTKTLEALPVQTMDLRSTEQLKQAWARGETLELGDPTLARVEMALQKTFYPLGFPVVLSTNSEEVLEAACESWGNSGGLFDLEPVRINIGVTEGGSPICPPTPICRMREHLLSQIADAENFCVSDLAQGFSLVWVTQRAVEQRSYFRYFFLESTAMAHIANRHAWGIHAACVDLNGAGVLLCGDSGAGKSTLAYACARAGWTFVTDDGSFLVNGREDRLVVGDSARARFRPATSQIFPELNGRPVIQRAEVGKPSIEFATDRASGIATSPTSEIRHIVFLNRTHPEEEMVPFPAEVAMLYMMQRASAVPGQRRQQEKMFDHLLAVGAFELRYSNLDWAVERLSQLVCEGC